ncbi:MAG: sigma 54-interacting transcriptional regulator [Verrucomicrobia bacterium]|nr:sigma 54-interacting transcriptional regulator [Verrucomicrobiota bacterium]
MPDRPHDRQRDIILDSVADGVFTVNAEWRITSFNRAAERITGVERAEAIGKRCCDVFRASICETDCALRRTMETGKPVVNRAVYIVNAQGERVPISISTALLRDDTGQIIGGVETFRDLSLVEELRKELDGRHAFEDIISRNHRMQGLFDILPEVARSDATVLIEGESGTGKELVARAIHNLSPRRRKRLVTVNCGALPDTLLESELFGHTAGAFTDAKRDRKGRFALADGGTIFLDEIGDVSPALQVRLLRVLQEKAYEPLGGTETLTADARVIAATNRKLDELVAHGTFRQDLYYRINVVRLELPPLRERKEDIPLLIEHFIGHFNRLRGKDVSGISPEVLAILMGHDYPGNVRELENILEHAFVVCPGGMIEPRHLPEHLRPAESLAPVFAGAQTLREIEARFIRDALARNNWSRLATAKELGVHKSTLFRKIRSLGIHLPDQDGRTRQ